ncbi:MAG: transposase [Thermodesulfobacteriota bacterium]|jgi:REP element-mobilizing transposase RayT
MVRVLMIESAKKIFQRHPEVKKELWEGEFWEDGCFLKTFGNRMTSDTNKKYINYHRHIEKNLKLLAFDF